MPTQDASKIRERILSILRMKGPTIPVYISQEVGISMLFASAFLSELLSDKLIKMSSMRVGNSPIYYISGQEPQLENFSKYLKSKEKEAFQILQEKKFLKDSEQSPAIRVALREIKDFAFPFRRGNETFWRYLTSKESEFKYDIKPIEQHQYVEPKPRTYDQRERELGEKIIKDIKIEDIEDIRKEKEKLEKKEKPQETKEQQEEIIEEIQEEIKEDIEEDIIKDEQEIEENEKEQEIKETKESREEQEDPKEKKKPTKEKTKKAKPKTKIQKTTKKKANEKQDNKFFDKIKEFLSKETIEILSVESFNKNEIHLKIKSEGQEKLLVAYNKKRIMDTDIINANKKASQLNLKYVILSMGEPSKKLSNLIEAAQNLGKVEKIEK